MIFALSLLFNSHMVQKRDMRLVVGNCVRLKEVDFSGSRLTENCMELLVNNISTNVKVGLGARVGQTLMIRI